MATVTPIYNWPVPTSTDYVKDGATAIESLGDAIDSSLNSITGGKNVGLVHINTTTFSAASTVSVDNVFTTTYDYYRVMIFLTAGSNTYLNARLRVGGADNSTSNYASGQVYGAFGSTTLGNDNAGTTLTSWRFGFSNPNVSMACDIFNPRLATNTQFNGSLTRIDTQSTMNGSFNATTAFDGLTLLPAVGTISGNIKIYGYRNS
jgi:hypothetical protein